MARDGHQMSLAGDAESGRVPQVPSVGEAKARELAGARGLCTVRVNVWVMVTRDNTEPTENITFATPLVGSNN